MKNKKILEEALVILSNASQTKIEDLKYVFHNDPQYKTFYQPKRSGGKREINAPVGKTRIVQTNLYYNFFCKISTGLSINPHYCGGIPKKSVSDGINAHLFKTPNFVVDIDLKDAFHCVDRLSLQNAIYDLLVDEVLFYKSRYYCFLESKKNKEFLLSINNNDIDSVISEILKRQTEIIANDKLFETHYRIISWHNIYEYIERFKKRRMLFTNKSNKEWRSLIRHPNQVERVYELCEAMAFILSKILTKEGKLPQGSPTSMILMALVMSHTKILNHFKEFFVGFSKPTSFPAEYERVSVYVDNITLSVFTKLSKQELSENIRRVIDKLSMETIWRVNMDKVHVYDPSIEHPLVLGQRLVRHRKTRQELKNMTKKKSKVQSIV